MGPVEINGLPAHAILVHVVVVLVPVAALCLVLSAWWPVARRRLGVVTPLLALGALVSVPITTRAGEWLRDRVGQTPLVAKHAALGHDLLPWVIALFVLATLNWAWFRRLERNAALEATGEGSAGVTTTGDGSAGVTTMTRERTVLAPLTRGRTPIVLTLVTGVLSVALAIGTVVQCYRIGDSGAKAVWTGTFTEQPR